MVREGKTVRAYYAIRRYLVERKATIWCRGHSCYLFIKRRRSPYFRTLVWTIVDSDESKEGVPSHFVTHLSTQRTVVTNGEDCPRCYHHYEPMVEEGDQLCVRLCMEFMFMFSLSGYIWLTAPSAFVLPIYENIASQFGQLAILETCFGLILPYHATCSYDDYLRPRRLFVAFRS